MKKEKIKNQGQVYTPKYIVENMLDFVEYNDSVILKKHIIDNSCGNGAFLTEIVKRYCISFLKNSNSKQILKKDLETYIHGIEVQEDIAEECKKNLNNIIKNFGIVNVDWDVKCKDALIVNQYNNKMDFVVGNPPYVRVHNLKNNYDNVKKFDFSQQGMTDLYIVFFEIGFNMLNSQGKMCLITPSSFLKSNAGMNLRKYVYKNKNLYKIIDLEHFQPFNATTYTVITLFENKKHESIEYFLYDTIQLKPYKIDNLKYDDMVIDNKIYLAKTEDLRMLYEVERHYKNINKRNIVVKNGFATLADTVFIDDFNIKDEHVIDVIKASTGKKTKCIFPYYLDGKKISESELRTKHLDIYSYLLSKKHSLKNRDIDNEEWFAFGRTQAIKDVSKYKISVNTIIKDIKSIKINESPAGTGIYSGLYILTDHSLDTIKSILETEDFINYLKLLKNYKSGGYYTFSSLELEKFLTYKLEKCEHEQLGLFASYN